MVTPEQRGTEQSKAGLIVAKSSWWRAENNRTQVEGE